MATDPSRRDFLISSIALGAATAAAACRTAQTPQPRAPRFEVGAPTRTGSAAIASSCQFCNACCGIDVSVHAGHVMRIDAFADDPVQAGQLCIKAAMMNEIYSSRHRLERPLKRVGGDKGSAASRFAPVTWDEAFDTIAKKWLALRDGGRAHAIASRTTGRMLRGVDALIGRVFAMLGSPNNMDVGPVCNDAGGNALATTFGLGAFTNGYGRDEALGQDDLAASRFFLFLGTNQAETHPVTFAHLLRGRQKTKAKLVVVDPRHTATAAQADRWLAIRPHTDMALALGMLSHIIEHGLYDKAFVARWVLGFDALRAHLSKHGYTTAWAAKMTDLPEAEIRALAEGYARAKPAAIFCNAGISHQLGAFDTYRALAMLAAITGNIGVPGGGCNFMHNTWPGPLSLPAVKAKLPARRGSLPVGPDRMAHAILAGEPYPLSALITVGILYSYRGSPFVKDKRYLLYGFGSLFLMGLGLRAMYLGVTR